MIEYLKKNEEKFCAFRWITFEGFSDEEMEAIEKHWSTIPQLDGFDLEGKCCCFKFHHYVPRNMSELKKCKELNEQYANRIMNKLSKTVSRFRCYFNVGRLKMKRI